LVYKQIEKNFLTIQNLEILAKSEEFSLKNAAIGGAEGSVKLKISKISIKIEVDLKSKKI
jgi:hypothetical protein